MLSHLSAPKQEKIHTTAEQSKLLPSLLSKVIISLLILFLFNDLKGQMHRLSAPNLITETDIYIDQRSNCRYSRLITIKFTKPCINYHKEIGKVRFSDILYEDLIDILKCVENKFGKFELTKLVPNAEWGDTLMRNQRTGRLVHIPDWSQVFQMRFDNLVPVDSIILKLVNSDFIEYAEGPFEAYKTISPNDQKHKYGNDWALKIIQAEDAWDITIGDSTIVIGIHDNFGDTNVTALHEDLIGKVDRHFDSFGDHGICVAGIAGAKTNNGIGIASLGWNLRLKFYDNGSPIVGILNAVNDGVDILNLSHITRANLRSYRDAVKTALAAGIICVAAAGNDHYKPPEMLYPAAYNFEGLGKVIAVSGTMMTENVENFIEGFNYCPGSDPMNDPKSSFIDLAAPGMDIVTLSEDCCSSYINACGTSLSAPFVSALIGLMLSVDKTLAADEIYDILTNTAEKVGQYEYDENGWNKYLGYGRINAYKTLIEVKSRTFVDVEETEIISNQIKLEQNYPNPFNPSTTINYTIPARVGTVHELSDVDLVIYDILGREAAILVNQKQRSGNYAVTWSGVNYPSGVYIYKLHVGDCILTKKMLLIK